MYCMDVQSNSAYTRTIPISVSIIFSIILYRTAPLFSFFYFTISTIMNSKQKENYFEIKSFSSKVRKKN